MATKIKVWQIKDETLSNIETTLEKAGRSEADLESWIRNNSSILGEDILIVGEQVPTKTGKADYLGIDNSGSTVIIELKRGKLPRDVLAQAIDYASDIASWEIEKINEACMKYTQKYQGNVVELEDYISENFEGFDLEETAINQDQRILVVGFEVEEALQRMVEWLSDNYDVNINAVSLTYSKTGSGDEMISRTMIIPEEVVQEKIVRKKRTIATSDEAGTYEEDKLRELLKGYLSGTRKTERRIREILLPLCLKKEVVSRDEIKDELLKRGEAKDITQAGRVLSTISSAIGFMKNDFLRQIIKYDKPYPWERDNFKIDENYKNLVKEVLDAA